MKKQLLILTLILSFGWNAKASHVQTGEIWYEYTGVGSVYKVHVNFASYYDPGAINFPDTLMVYFLSTPNPPSYFGFSRKFLKTNQYTYNNGCSHPDYLSYNFDTINTQQNNAIRIIEYSDTVTLLPSLNWAIRTESGPRMTNSSNITGIYQYGMFLQAFLNNATQVNSSAFITNPSLDFITTNQSIYLNTVDLENDSIAYEFYQPLDCWNNIGNPSITLAPLAYNIGYSLSQPFGPSSSSTIDSVTHIMTLFTPPPIPIGIFQLGLKIKDYRNGILMGCSTRDFMVMNETITYLPTYPYPAPNTNFNYTTCPGTNNSISLTFNDSLATDSVYLNVIPPSIPGFTFTVNNSYGLGTSTTNISWATPANFNPATMPNFLIKIIARNNHCPIVGKSFFDVKVNTSQCNADSVWSGDANGDWSVNVYDPLAIGVAYGHSGWLRPNATANWQAEFCMNWVDTFANGINMKHADCNGDGVVDTMDLSAVYTNYGDWHLKQTPQAKTTNVPDLYFDISGIAFVPGATVNIPIKLGTSTTPMNNVYGIASKIGVGGISLSSVPQLLFTGSWMGNSTNSFEFAKNTTSTNIDWAFTRRNHQNISGNGTIGWLTFTIPSDAGGQTVMLSFGNTKLVNNMLQNITSFNANDTSAYIQPVGIENVNNNIIRAAVVPNPSSNEALLEFTTMESRTVELSVMDMTGKVVYAQKLQASKGSNLVGLPQGISSGIYHLKIGADEQMVNVKWMKE
jgi:hypothetical protein